MKLFNIELTTFRIIIIVAVPLLLGAYQLREISGSASTDIQETDINGEKKGVVDKQNDEGFFKIAKDRKPGGYNELQGRFEKDSTSGFFSFLSPEKNVKEEGSEGLEENTQQTLDREHATPKKKKNIAVLNATSFVSVSTEANSINDKVKDLSLKIDTPTLKPSTLRIFKRYREATPISTRSSYDKSSIEIMAQVWEKTKVRDGSRVTLVIIKDAVIQGERISAGSFLYGLVSFVEDRLEIEIQTNNIVLHAYDVTDNLKGIFAPTLMEQQLAREAKLDAINSGTGATINTSAIPLLQNVTINAAKKKIAESSIVLNAKTAVLLKP